MDPSFAYRFNIINVSKLGGCFGQGMQPVMFSKSDYLRERTAWRRVGTDISHHGNHYRKDASREETYATVHFTVKFPASGDECYLAHHYPYAYSQLLVGGEVGLW